MVYSGLLAIYLLNFQLIFFYNIMSEIIAILKDDSPFLCYFCIWKLGIGIRYQVLLSSLSIWESVSSIFVHQMDLQQESVLNIKWEWRQFHFFRFLSSFRKDFILFGVSSQLGFNNFILIFFLNFFVTTGWG